MLSTKLKEAAGNGIASTLYVDDVFSTWLYTGNGSTQTITNGIDLAGQGGMVWIKDRSRAVDHGLYDTVRGALNGLQSNLSTSNQAFINTLTGFNSNGFSLGADSSNTVNLTNDTYASWTFRKAAKFFDVVTYTGNGVAGRQIAHSLGVAPGMIVIKATNKAYDWGVHHRSTGVSNIMYLNLTNAQSNNPYFISATDSSTFTVGYGGLNSTYSNESGTTYVAYLFAHDTSSTGIIQCGSYTGNGSATGPTVSLGWEPQYLMIKNATGSSQWQIRDVQRGLTVGAAANTLMASTADAETPYLNIDLKSTGFQIKNTDSQLNTSGSTYIYMAIRRPNKPPTTGTQVYNAIARTGTGAVATVTGVGFSPDLLICEGRQGYNGTYFVDRLRGISPYLNATTIDQEISSTNSVTSFNMDGVSLGADTPYGFVNYTNYPNRINYFFKRAPGFMDVVCYTGTGVANRSVDHNLGVAPELIITKHRTTAGWDWYCYHSQLGLDKYIILNTNASAGASSGFWTSMSNTKFGLGSSFNSLNSTGDTFVAYLFATLAGISKVGSYTGNGSSQNIECGFAAGARFILIKCTSTIGDWFVWDTARGIVAANDPHLSLNTTAAEVTTDDSVDPYSAGFAINQVAATNINVSSATYIFLAIA